MTPINSGADVTCLLLEFLARFATSKTERLNTNYG